MPQLPPRNLPLSPPSKGSSAATPNRQASQSTPAQVSKDESGRLTPSKKASKAGRDGSATPSRPSGSSRTASRLASASLSPGPSSPLRSASISIASESGTLERQDETTFHRRLRALLIDHSVACAAWEEVVSMQGAKSIRNAAQAAASLDELLARGSRLDKSTSTTQEQRERAANAKELSKDDELPVILALSPEEQEARRLDDVAKALQALDAESIALEAMLTIRLAKATTKLEGLADAAEALLLEATNARGDEFTFGSEFWTTWSMDRFVSTLQTITEQYTLQAAQLAGLVEVLFMEGCVAGAQQQDEALPAKEKDITANGKEGLDEEDDEDDESNTVRVSSKDKAAAKRRALIRQRVLEVWQALPLLHDDKNGIDATWFEEICSVEVGRWHEE